MDGAREQVQSSEIGAEQVDEAFARAEQMDVHRDQPPKIIGRAADEELNLPMLAGVERAFHAQSDGIALRLAAIDERSQVEIAFRIEEMRHHRCASDIFCVAL